MSDANVPPQPGGTPEPDGQQPYGAPTPPAGQQPFGEQPPAAPYGATPPPPAGQQPYGTTPPAGQPYGQPGAQQPYGAPQQPYGQPGAQQPYGQPGAQQPYGQQPFGQQSQSPIDVAAAFGYAWEKFTKNIGTILLGALAWGVGIAILIAIFYAIIFGGAAAASSIDPSGGLFALGFGSLVVFLAVVSALVLLFQAAATNVGLAVTAGRKLTIRDFFVVPNLVQALLTALVIGVVSGLSSALVVGPLVVAFFGIFAIHFAIDKGLGVVDAIKASIDVAMKNAAQVVILMLAVAVANAVGSAICGIGIIVSMPVAMIATAYCYRRVVGQQPA